MKKETQKDLTPLTQNNTDCFKNAMMKKKGDCPLSYGRIQKMRLVLIGFA